MAHTVKRVIELFISSKFLWQLHYLWWCSCTWGRPDVCWQARRAYLFSTSSAAQCCFFLAWHSDACTLIHYIVLCSVNSTTQQTRDVEPSQACHLTFIICYVTKLTFCQQCCWYLLQITFTDPVSACISSLDLYGLQYYLAAYVQDTMVCVTCSRHTQYSLYPAVSLTVIALYFYGISRAIPAPYSVVSNAMYCAISLSVSFSPSVVNTSSISFKSMSCFHNICQVAHPQDKSTGMWPDCQLQTIKALFCVYDPSLSLVSYSCSFLECYLSLGQPVTSQQLSWPVYTSHRVNPFRPIANVNLNLVLSRCGGKQWLTRLGYILFIMSFKRQSRNQRQHAVNNGGRCVLRKLVLACWTRGWVLVYGRSNNHISILYVSPILCLAVLSLACILCCPYIVWYISFCSADFERLLLSRLAFRYWCHPLWN